MSEEINRSIEPVVIIGAGPAGLTAAFELSRYGLPATVLELDEQVGGISRTVERDGWRFDLGGHRFFTKVSRVEDFWHEILPSGDFLQRPRMSRIYYNNKFFDYPLKASNALGNLGFFEALRCVASYFIVKFRRPKDQESFEGWVASRFGWRLYRIFFKTYTEKVWGMPAHQIRADWAAQRIKNLSLGKAILHALSPKTRENNNVTSLIEAFQYPKYGPGMMWERCAELVEQRGGTVKMKRRVTSVSKNHDGQVVVSTECGEKYVGSTVISTMPINRLVQCLDPVPPEPILKASHSLRHRDFLTVALVVPQSCSFPDNWIYIHSPGVKVGRIQNFGSWSPFLVKDDFTCLGMEYFVTRGDETWNSPDDDLIELATRELESLGLVTRDQVGRGYVVRVPYAYPIYDSDYADALKQIREYLAQEWPTIRPVGRNGMHRYNNQDHSMFTAMLTVDEMMGKQVEDVWNVNVEADYHETKS